VAQSFPALQVVDIFCQAGDSLLIGSAYSAQRSLYVVLVRALFNWGGKIRRCSMSLLDLAPGPFQPKERKEAFGAATGCQVSMQPRVLRMPAIEVQIQLMKERWKDEIYGLIPDANHDAPLYTGMSSRDCLWTCPELQSYIAEELRKDVRMKARGAGYGPPERIVSLCHRWSLASLCDRRSEAFLVTDLHHGCCG
jgi:hypothetical protein